MYTINGKEYVYFLKGKFVKIKEKNTLSSTPILVDPTDTIEGGVMMDITRVPNFDGITKESHDLPIPEALEEALVMYVKGQLSEDLQTREYYLQSFNKKVSRFDSTRAGGARIAKGSWVLR